MSGNLELFTTQVKKATRKMHSLSDTLVNAKFTLALREEIVWGRGIFVFYHIFAFIEEAKERLKMPELDSLFVDRIIYRKRAFEEDLTHYFGPDWNSMEKSKPLEQYLEHLKELENNQPELLMAYFYHLYLGLLSGGQLLIKKRRMFGQNDINVYLDKVTEFNDHDIPQLKNEIRAAMNEIAEKWTVEQKEAFIAESNRMFMLNNTVVSAISGQNEVLREVIFKVAIVTGIIIGMFVAVKYHK